MSAIVQFNYEARYVQLNAFWLAVSTANALYPLQTSEQRTGNVTRLNGVKLWLTRLGPSGDYSPASTAPAKWDQTATIQAQELAAIMSGLGESNVLSRFWSEVLVPTGTEVGTTVKDAATGTGIGFGAVLALVLVIVVLK